MALQFPANPSVGDTYERWTWDGGSWVFSVSYEPSIEALTTRVEYLETNAVKEGDDVKKLRASTVPDGTNDESDYLVLAVNTQTGDLVGLEPVPVIEAE